VDRKWFYADEALNFIRTFEGHELVWTDAEYTPPNSPPLGPDGTVDLATDEDVPLDIDLAPHFTDPDGDALTFGLLLVGGSAGNATLEGTGPARTLTPVVNWSGVLDLQATVTDPFGQKATGDFRVTVRAVNDPPHVVWVPHNLATEEDMSLYNAHDASQVFDDVDGDALTLSANSTEGVTAFMNGTFVDLIPDPDWTGKAIIELIGTDPSGEVAIVFFDLLVGGVNDPPIIVSSGGPARIHETDSGEFWVQVEDKDSVDLEFTWTVEGSPMGGVDGPFFTYAPGDLTVSSVTVAVTVEDDWNAKATMSWDVAIMDSPTIVGSGPASPVFASVGDTVIFSIDVEDADTAEPDIRWLWNGDLVGSGEELPMLFGARDTGTGHLLVVVDDGVGNDTVEWDVNVTVPNKPPSVQIQRVADSGWPTVGVAVYLKAGLHDDDIQSLTITWTVDGSPEGYGPDLSYTPTDAGEVVVTVTVDDGEFTDSDSLTMDVRPAPDDDDDDGSAETGGLWIPLLLMVAIVVVMVLVYLRTRPGRQG
jgi:hypothetical protein